MKKAMMLAAVLFFAVAAVALAAPKATPSADNGLKKGASESYQLYLYEKDADWKIVNGGAWGKLNINDDKFVFNGHGLAEYGKYALIYYPDPWPGKGCISFGTGQANDYGDVHIKGEFAFDTLLKDSKIWLVLDADQACNNNAVDQMVGWNPAEYLFEYALLNVK